MIFKKGKKFKKLRKQYIDLKEWEYIVHKLKRLSVKNVQFDVEYADNMFKGINVIFKEIHVGYICMNNLELVIFKRYADLKYVDNLKLIVDTWLNYVLTSRRAIRNHYFGN